MKPDMPGGRCRRKEHDHGARAGEVEVIWAGCSHDELTGRDAMVAADIRGFLLLRLRVRTP
jgi:hypothetical protein